MAIAANLFGAATLFTAESYVAATFALILSPLPLISALIFGAVDGNWVVLFLNLPVVGFVISLPIVTFIMDRLRVL